MTRVEGETLVDSVPPPSPPAPPAHETVAFTGTGSEYFRIWIVNLALTVATLGIFSAWAKVRRMQYFYRHTRLAGAGFDYHGSPIAILKGRIVGLILLGLYSTAGYFNPWVAVGIFLALAVVMPWLLVRSLRFRLHNSSYRGLRFKFHGTTRQGYWVFLALPVFTFLSLFTLGPFWHHRLKRFQFGNAAYGASRLTFGALVGEFYVTYILAAFASFVLFVVTILVVVAGTAGAVVVGGGAEQSPGPAAAVAFVVVFALAYGMTITAAQAITTTRIHNECWNTARLDHVRFTSTVSARRLFVILYTNILATVGTLGLYRPFAQVRLARYFAGTMTVSTAVGLAAFTAAESTDVTAVGEETADLFDFDIAF